MSYLLIVSQHAPYHSSHAKDALEVALSASNVEMPVKFAFVENGIFQLMDNQTGNAISHKSHLKQLSLLPIYDVEDIYVVESSRESLPTACVQPWLTDALSLTVIDNNRFAKIAKNATQVLVF
ncbi:DsrE family protein [Agaribacter marinus]|uniref:Sulfurtransferase TusC n=1 Tax=Agaribacter marinus TaxID=1431249 RepID=A0AA37T1I0_9ALTE|nr:DsrE family protein [Agaribacter marinus]GLR69985.1 sulfurtransferase TusC [Agaribacter marinus]